MDFVNESGLEAAWTVSKLHPPQFSLTAFVKGTFRLRPGGPAVLAEGQIPLTGDGFEGGDPTRALRYPSDFAPFKPRTDISLVGTCYAPGAKPVSVIKVGFRLGPLAKSLAVFGDRYWTGQNVATQPAPFTAMPLTFEQAYGGLGFASNPLGKGFLPITGQDGSSLHPLPNIESPGRLTNSPRDAVVPVGFGPLPDTWPQRLRKAGTFGSGYLKERWPWQPADFDWGFFNSAPEDQQLEDILRGDEDFYAENLHPSLPQYRSRLPGVRVRCFLNEQHRAQLKIREIPMRLDTVWIDMDAETLILVWRGNVPVRTQKLIEVEHFLAITEAISQPYATAEQVHGLLYDALERREQGEEELEPEAEPEDKAADAQDMSDVSDEAVLAASDAGAAEGQEDGEAVAAESASADEMPLSVARVRQMILGRQNFAGCDLSGLVLAGFDFSGCDLREAILEGAVLVKANLGNADLSGAILAGANLRQANCAGARLTEADLTEAWLTEADLSATDLSGADMTKARMRCAVLRGANATYAVFAEADLSDANLAEANLTGADFCDARVHRTDFTRADLTDAAFENAWGRYVKAPGAILRKLRAAKAVMCEGNFRECLADESVWESAELFAADFTGASLNGAEMSGAYLFRACFDAADARAARLNEASLREAQMHRCNLLAATLDQADLTQANLCEANLFGATLMDVILDKTNLTGANLRRIKSREASA